MNTACQSVTCQMKRLNAVRAYRSEQHSNVVILKLLSVLFTHIQDKNLQEIIRICSGLCSAINTDTKDKNLKNLLENIGELYALIIKYSFLDQWNDAENIVKHLTNFYRI